MKHKSKAVKTLVAVILVVAGVCFLYPIVWLFLTSFKGPKEVYSNPVGLPHEWLFSNYVNAFEKFDFMQYFMNSVIYTGFTVLVVLICVTLFTYATARMRFRGANKLQSYLQFGLVIPGGVTLLGIYQILMQTGLRNTYPGLVLAYSAMYIPLAAVILYGFFRSLPFTLEEAAAIDGAGTFKTFFKIILPMVIPALATIATITAMNTWNEYMLAAITIDVNAMKSLPVGVASFMTARGGDWGGMAAALMLASLPTMVLYLIFSEKLEQTLTTSSAGK